MNDEFLSLLRPFLRYAGDRPIRAETPLRDLGLDSMRTIELLFAIEETYEVIVPDGMLTDATFETTGSLWAALEQLCAPTLDRNAR